MNPHPVESEIVPAPLREGVVALDEQLMASPELAGVSRTIRSFRSQLLRVLTTSPYAADILVRYPAMLAELLTSDRLRRTTTADDYAELLRASLPPDPDEEELQRRLRLFRHRELVRIIWRDLAGTPMLPRPCATCRIWPMPPSMSRWPGRRPPCRRATANRAPKKVHPAASACWPWASWVVTN